MDNAQVTVREIETVTGDFLTEAGEPFYRIEIDGYCADFDHLEAAENFAAAINQMFALHRLERSEPVGWMGIESAPRDGTDILVMYMHIDTQCVFNAFCASPDDGWEPEDEGWWSYEHSEVGRIKLEGWMTPTHWMPLPSAPGTTHPEPVAEIERLREENERDSAYERCLDYERRILELETRLARLTREARAFLTATAVMDNLPHDVGPENHLASLAALAEAHTKLTAALGEVS